MTTFNPLNFNGCEAFLKAHGVSEQETARNMCDALKQHHLDMSYDASTKRFTVLNSKDLDKQTVIQIFQKKCYQFWEPKVLDETDPNGNQMVELVGCKSVYWSTPVDSRDSREELYRMVWVLRKPVSNECENWSRPVYVRDSFEELSRAQQSKNMG